MSPMSATHPELPVEQAYIDRARSALKEMEVRAGALAEGAVDKEAARRLHVKSLKRLAVFEAARDQVCFARIDARDQPPRYLGRTPVWDEGAELLVISWQARA